MVRASHILIEYEGSCHKASWKDPEGQVNSATMRDAAAARLGEVRDQILTGCDSFADPSAQQPDLSSARLRHGVELENMQSTNRISNTPITLLCLMIGPQGWANLPLELLHSIIGMLGSTRDLLAFIATCPSWHAAFMSIRSTLGALFPPLIFRICANRTSTTDSTLRNTWELIDLSYPSTPLRRLSPPCILDTMTFVECSHGHAIFSFDRSHIIVDMFTGTTVIAPPCPVTQLCYRAFIAPHASQYSYLFVSGPQCLFAWRVGSPSWLHCDYINAHMIKQIVTFKGRIFARTCHKLYVVHLSPELRLEALRVVCGMNLGPPKLCGTLVVCDNMVLMLDDLEAFFLDLSTKPAKYLRVEDGCLEKQAFFFDKEDSGQPRHIMNPERLGLRGSHTYQLNHKGQVYSYPTVYDQDLHLPVEPILALLSTYILRNPATFTTWA
uniref:Uncharacterized protein n=1 Tax=Avena sativa TaxID=4498 RepID=A0ACD5V6D0_AVESA